MGSELDLLIYIPSLSGGGAERAVIDIATNMTDRGYRCAICCNQLGESYRHLVADRGVRTIELNVERTARALPGLAKSLLTLRPRTLLATITHANVVATVAAKSVFSAPRIVLRQANTMVSSAETTLRARVATRAVPWVYRRADRVVAVSAATADDLVQHGVPRRMVAVIANGVDHASIADEASKTMERPPPPLADSAKVLVSLGRLTTQKAFDTLIRTLATLPNHVHLWIFGEGSDRKPLEDLAVRMGIADRIWMPGFVSNPFPYIKRADGFVLCSRWEGMPNALIQALSLGTPCVATDAPGGSREVLQAGKTGWLVPVDDTATLGDAIRSALAEPEARAAGEAWRERFSVETMMDCYEKTLFA